MLTAVSVSLPNESPADAELEEADSEEAEADDEDSEAAEEDPDEPQPATARQAAMANATAMMETRLTMLVFMMTSPVSKRGYCIKGPGANGFLNRYFTYTRSIAAPTSAEEAGM